MTSTGTLQTTGTHTSLHLALARDDLQIVQALRAGDEAAFVALLERHNAGMVCLARLLTGDAVTADELIQETWRTILDRLDRYDCDTSLKIWIFTALLDCAADRRKRHSAGQAVTSLSISGTFPAKRLDSPADERWPTVCAAMTSLPLLQLAVVTLRDVEGWRPDEVCTTLGLSEPQGRMLLHHARTTVLQALGPYLSADRPIVANEPAC